MFVIERDHIESGHQLPIVLRGEAEIRHGPFCEVLELPEHDDAGKELPKIQFRLYDDDDELYYEGWLHDDWEATNQSVALTWAEIDSGCTTIKVRRGCEWKQEIG